MEVAIEPDPMEVELPDGLRVAYTRLDHVPKSLLDNLMGEVPGELMERLNTRLFMTTRDRGLPHHIAIGSTESGLKQPSWARTEDIRAISTTRFTRTAPLGRLSDQEVEQVRRWVHQMLA